MNRILRIAAIALLVVAAAYVAGYWPERSRRAAAESELAAVRGQLDEAEARVRAAALLGSLLYVTEAVSAQNYGQAQELASRFFDAVGAEAGRTPLENVRPVLQRVVQLRDGIIAALARADPSALEPLRRAQLDLRESLGYPVARPSEP